jgi:N-carbamoylputrescine amidase
LNGSEIVFIPSATSRGLSQHLWKIEQTSHAIANGYFVGTINRVGIEPLGDNDFYGQSYFCTPRGEFVGDVGDTHEEELMVRDLDMELIEEVRNVWQFYRDRRPDAYDPLVNP